MFIVCIEKGQNIISHLCDSEVASVSAEAAWPGASHKIHYELEMCVCVCYSLSIVSYSTRTIYDIIRFGQSTDPTK